ncbi:siphovirus Gp157 family protein [Streptococcus porcinus]|uniref:Siphovirus Gp157 family protein n=1 Tax=Streptococcus porcinus TaxID=1340 RepID=A0A7V9WTG4_STRPO|nr:siphovirus Gp157 family protein [Streptococcus porcinus]MBA2796583.1 siphovirus Gp157 family protein [Streptococcus porcinus]
MALLYELEGIYAQLESMELDDETFQDTLDSIDFQNDLEKTIEYFAKMKANADAKAIALKSEKERFNEKEKKEKAKSDKYKEIINDAMKMSNKKKIETELFTISKRNSKVVKIIDETKIPLEFMNEKITYTPMKKELKQAIESGQVVEGAELGYNESVVIK